jgi:hypothetical protein
VEVRVRSNDAGNDGEVSGRDRIIGAMKGCKTKGGGGRRCWSMNGKREGIRGWRSRVGGREEDEVEVKGERKMKRGR